MILTALFRSLFTRSLRPFVFNAVDEDGASPSLLPVEASVPGLYVHIPFCTSLCPFCPYCKVLFDENLAQDYLAALLKEIDIAGRAILKGNGKRLRASSLYFGGGTPSLMSASLKTIMDRLDLYFEIEGGRGVELHPRDVSNELLSSLKAAGITMISLGIQSFDRESLSVLGREESLNEEIFDAVRNAGFEVVDMDLIFGIPGQTEEGLKRDMATAFERGATQVSTYPFIDFSFAENKKKPLPEREKKKMLSALAQFGRDIDVERTSVWTFARHNSEKYSSVTRDSFYGFGVSATSLFSREFKVNTHSIPDYILRIEKGLLPTALRVDFSPRQRAVYYLFWSAYGMNIDAGRFFSFFGKKLESMFSLEMYWARKLALVETKTYTDSEGRPWQRYTLNERGAYLYHWFEQRYTTAYIDTMWRVCRTNPWPKRLVLS